MRAPTRTWPGLEADISSLGAETAGGPARIAIVSYEFNGVVRNGGIGTACTSLARELAEDGHEVDLIFTGWADDPSDEAFDRWRKRYRKLDLTLERIDPEEIVSHDTVLYNASHSLALYRLLRDRDRERPYNVIHFVESVGHGFYSQLAKRQGLAFQSATMVVGVHSPRRWLTEAHGIPFDDPLEIGDEFLERRSIELADVVVSPSAHMLDWLEKHGVVLPARSYVQQYVTRFGRDPGPRRIGEAASNGGGSKVRELVFFGRLEPRKGLPVFCDALDLLADGEYADLERITFLGRPVPFADVSSADYVLQRARSWPWECSVRDNLDRDAALDYLSVPGRLAVMPSSMDNSPNTVYEAIGLGIAFLASRGGGTAELVHPDDYERATYDPRDPEAEEIDPADLSRTRRRHTGRVLAERLEQTLAQPARPVRFAVDPVVNARAHVAWHRAAAAVVVDPVVAVEPADLSAVSSPALAVADIGAASATDELLLLVDSEASLAPGVGDVLRRAAAACPDASFFTGLGSFETAGPDAASERHYLPVGGPPVAGLLGNCFGVGAALARRDALERLGILLDGLPPGAGVADVLARAALGGERIDVVPEVLYRLPAGSVRGDWLSGDLGPRRTLAAYKHALADQQACDIAGVATRALAEKARLEERVEAAESAAAGANERLATILSSRSWRLTGTARRLALGLRRLGRFGRGGRA
jgi:glycosyltransferase involved in cell wall biosynthesis